MGGDCGGLLGAGGGVAGGVNAAPEWQAWSLGWAENLLVACPFQGHVSQSVETMEKEALALDRDGVVWLTQAVKQCD